MRWSSAGATLVVIVFVNKVFAVHKNNDLLLLTPITLRQLLNNWRKRWRKLYLAQTLRQLLKIT